MPLKALFLVVMAWHSAQSHIIEKFPGIESCNNVRTGLFGVCQFLCPAIILSTWCIIYLQFSSKKSGIRWLLGSENPENFFFLIQQHIQMIGCYHTPEKTERDFIGFY